MIELTGWEITAERDKALEFKAPYTRKDGSVGGCWAWMPRSQLEERDGVWWSKAWILGEKVKELCEKRSDFKNFILGDDDESPPDVERPDRKPPEPSKADPFDDEEMF